MVKTEDHARNRYSIFSAKDNVLNISFTPSFSLSLTHSLTLSLFLSLSFSLSLSLTLSRTTLTVIET